MKDKEPQTSSELMMQNQMAQSEGLKAPPFAFKQKEEPSTVLPSQEIQKFLLDLINQAGFPGSMSEFVTSVKREIASAQIG